MGCGDDWGSEGLAGTWEEGCLEMRAWLDGLLGGRLDMPRDPGYMIGSKAAQIISI